MSCDTKLILKSNLNRMLMTLLGSEALVEKWWISPNLAFDSKTPNEVFDTNLDTVTRYIIEHTNSVYW